MRLLSALMHSLFRRHPLAWISLASSPPLPLFLKVNPPPYYSPLQTRAPCSFARPMELLEESGITIFDTSIRPKQSVRASYGFVPDDLAGYDEVAAQLVHLLSLEKES